MTFYKETEFRETTIGKIPKEWDVKETEELGEVVTGITPSTFVKEYWNGDYPFVTPTDMTNGKYVEKTERKVTAKGLEKGRLIPKDSVLVTCIASIGKMALAFEDCLTNQQINAIICKEGVNPHYVYYALGFRTPALKSWAGQTTNPIIKKSLFEKFPISLPRNEPEQQNIAEVLSTVDLAIQKTDNVIWKTERLKKGLMQTLLTRGIGHKEYKDTPIGKTPKTWQIMKLEDLSEDGIKNGVFKRRHEFGRGAPLINVLDLFDGLEVNFRKLARVSVNERELHQFKVTAGDILFCRSSLNVEGVGHACLVDEPPEPAVFECHVMRARPRKNVVLPQYLVVYCLSPYARQFILKHSKTTTMTTIDQPDLGKLPVALPSLQEQARIAKIVYTIEKKLELERKQKARLERVKRGFMDLLLTGKVRVKVD
jgi:type I restriction enzyme S subunit